MMFFKIDINIISLILIWFSILTILTHARNAKPGDCDPDREEYNKCGVLPSCEKTCEKPKTQICAKICSPGCFCIKPYIRKRENSTECVTEDKCNKIVK